MGNWNATVCAKGHRPDLSQPRATPWDMRCVQKSPVRAIHWVAPTGLSGDRTTTQGVALGWDNPGRWPSWSHASTHLQDARYSFVHILVFLLVWLISGVLAAADATPHVDMSATPNQIAVGETVAITVTYRWPHGWTMDGEPDPSVDFRNLFVTAAPPAERRSSGEEERRVFRYTVAAARSGAWQLPRPSLTVRGPQGPVTAQAPEVVVQVGTESAPPKLPEPRPLLLRAPDALASNSTMWWWIAGCSALIGALAIVWLLRRRQNSQTGPTPWQVFESEIARARLVNDSKEVGAGISLAVRRYAGTLWRFDGPGLTTREMGAALRKLKAGKISDDESRDLLRLLSRLDDLRWSAADAPADMMQDLVTLATTWAGGVQKRLDAEAAERERAKAAKQKPALENPA